ncbi:MAG TPA: esterase-like activity of phytase family protein [Bdellovibrionota bacterium]|jgi:hypothetical protein|nr:esterase-like activity of phytase family protein [Bdellovibrionota bacterium]
MKFLALISIAWITSCASRPAPQQLSWIGEQSFDQSVFVDGTQMGGLSGLHYDERTQRLVAVSDDPGMETSRGPGRWYQFKVDFKNGFRVSPERVVRLSGIRVGATDLESIAPAENGWLISMESETDKMNRFKKGDRKAISRPRLLRTTTRGHVTREFLLPPRFQPNAQGEHGVVLNAGIEGLVAVSDHHAGAQWAMVSEVPLQQDQAKFPLASRLTLFSLSQEGWTDRAEYVYEFSPLPKNIGFEAPVIDRGVSDLLYRGEGKFWVLERSFFFNKEQNRTRNLIEIYEVDVSHAPNTEGADTLKKVSPLKKKLIANLDDFIESMPVPATQVGHILDNVEGLTLGPQVDGHETLILVTDDNFGKTQRTAFRAFKILRRD